MRGHSGWCLGSSFGVRRRRMRAMHWCRRGLGALAAGAAVSTALAATYPGAIPASFAVGDQGDARYTIPIVAPAGTGGLEPNLALSYNHQAGNGLAGMRWSLSGLSAITRCQRTYAQDGETVAVNYGSTDRLCLDGRRLVSVAGNYGDHNTEYRTEIESFQRVFQQGTVGGGPQSFYVQHGNGLTSYYGATPNSRIEFAGTSVVRLWYLSYTVDQFGNQISYSYDENSTTGEVFPIEITWTSNAGQGLTPRYKIVITPETRPADDQRSGHDSGGAPWASTKRIDKIDVVYNGTTTISTYDLTYRTPPIGGTGRSQLEKVTLSRGADSLPDTVFTLQDGTRGWGSLASTGRSVGTFPLVGDMDGDGRQDLFVCLSGTWQVYPGQADGLLGTAINGGASCGTNPEQARVLDFDGNGRADLLYRSGTSWHVLKSIGGGGFISDPTGLTSSNVQNPATLDLDGDGLFDIVYDGGGALAWRRNLGGSLAAEQYIYQPTGMLSGYGPVPAVNSSVPMDANRDGRADLFAHVQECEVNPNNPYEVECQNHYRLLLATGTGWNTFTEIPITTLPENYYLTNFRAGDINGDGLLDLLYVHGLASTWFLQLNRGTSLGSTVNTQIPPAGADKVMIVDYDNDGRDDLVRVDSTLTNMYMIHRSNGSTLVSYTSLDSVGAFTAAAFAADVSGDGFPEIVRVSGSSWATHRHLSPLPDVVTKFTNGLGHEIALAYEPLANTSHYTLSWALAEDPPSVALRRYGGPRHVVTTETHDTAIGSGTRQYTHHYDTAWLDVAGRGWSSFKTHRVNDVAQGTYVRRTLRRTFPHTGMAELDEQRVTSGDALVRDVTYVLGNTSYASTPPEPPRQFPRVEQATAREYEVGGPLAGQHLRSVVANPEYDTTYGHVTTRATTTTDPLTGETWTSTTNFNPTADTDDWCLGQPGLVETTNTLPSLTSSTRRLRYTWNLDNCSLIQTTDESESDPAKRLQTVYTYDGYGNPNVVSQDSADGSAQNRSTDFDFDSFGQQPTAVTVGTVNLVTAFAWDYLTGQRASVTGADGLTISWLYDPFGRVAQESRPDGTTTITRTACGGGCWPQNAVFFARAQGSDGSDDYGYFDELGRPVGRAWTLPGGAQGREETRYTGTGRVDRVSRPYLSGDPVYWVTYAYDVIGRMVQENAPIDEANTSGALTTTEYRGHEVWLTDAEGGTTKYIHNAARQIKQVLDALNGSTQYTYAAFGELATVTDHQGNVTAIGYDARGLKASLNDPDLGSWSYVHNVYGELASETDAKTAPNPTRSYLYDPAGRIQQRVEPEGTTTWTYYTSGTGAIGKPDTISGPGNSEHYEYSASFGAQTLVRRVIDGVPYDTDYAYHTAGSGRGKLARITYPTSSLGTRLKVDYSYDSYGHLYQVYNGDAPSLVWYTLSSADALGRERTAILGNGVNEVRSYDRANGSLQSIVSGPSGAPTSVQNLAYQWDRVGNLEQRQDLISGKTEDFFYDALSRLRTLQINSATALSVDYDEIGNITYKSDVGSYQYGAGSAGPHAVTSVTGIQSNTYAYDANGNMNNKDGDTITWYSFNKPLRINYGTAYSELVYGVHRQRIKQTAADGSSGGVLRYIGPEFELLTQGPLRADLHHIFANGRAIARYTTYNFMGPDTRYLHRDSLGSIVATSSTTGTVLSRYEFDAFGLRWQTAGSGLFTQKGFTGHEHLDAVDLIDMVGRVQDPVLGRMLSADPFVQAPYYSQSLNRYSYAWNNPLTLVDPSGFQVTEVPVCQGSIGGDCIPTTPGICEQRNYDCQNRPPAFVCADFSSCFVDMVPVEDPTGLVFGHDVYPGGNMGPGTVANTFVPQGGAFSDQLTGFERFMMNVDLPDIDAGTLGGFLADSLVGFGDGVYEAVTLGVGDLAEVRGWGGYGYAATDQIVHAGGRTIGTIQGSVAMAGTGWAAGLNGGTRSVFWGNRALNMERAKAFGTTLEKTLIGRPLNAIGRWVPDPVWKFASYTFANNARGTATKVGGDVGRIWNAIEKPALEARRVLIRYID